MSDDNAVSLEDDGAAPPVAAAPPPEPATEPATEAPEATEDATPDVAVEGQKFVPLAALQAEREQAKALREQLQQANLAYQQQKPFIDFLQQNPGILQPRQEQPAPVASDDPRAVEMAQRLALFKPDGTLDVDAGKRTLGLVQQVAEESVQKHVAPLQQQSEAQRSYANFQHIVANGIQTPDGRTLRPHPAAVQAIWQNLPANYTSDPSVANALGIMALGLGVAGTTPTPAAPPPVVHTEASGGAPQARVQVSDLGRKIAAERGRTEKQWVDNMKGFNPKRTSTLED